MTQSRWRTSANFIPTSNSETFAVRGFYGEEKLTQAKTAVALERYYLKRGHFVAAVNRFRVVVENFETTSQTPEALHRLVESYLALGVVSEASKAAAVLGHNYPESYWYDKSYSLLNRVGVIGGQ